MTKEEVVALKQAGTPLLAFTRKYGWVVVRPSRVESEDFILGFSRPGGVRIERRHVLGTADLPPVPDAAK